MYGFTRSLWSTFMGITGLGKVMSQPVLGLVLVVCMALTVFWMIQFTPKASATMGKTFGGLAIGFIKLGIAMGIAMGIANILLNGGIGGLSRIPLIGTFLANTAGWLVGTIVGLVLAIMMGVYLIKNIGNILSQIAHSPIDSTSNWQEVNGGFHGVKWSYVLAGNLVIAWLICHPAWNASLFYLPAILSGLVGLFALAWTSVTGKTLVTQSLVTKKDERPRKSDDSWRCLNKGFTVLLDEEDQPIRNANGKIVAKVVSCRGPQGNDANGKPYNGWNPKEARTCLAPDCGYPNPYWQVCQKCGFARADGKGFPRTADASVKCPNCGYLHPALPKRLGFMKPIVDEPNSEDPVPAPEPKPES